MSTLIMETVDLDAAAQAEANLPPGRYEARLSLTGPLSQEALDSFQQDIVNAGVDVIGVAQQRVRGLWQVSVKYRIPERQAGIASWPALLIPVLPTIVTGILVGIALFKMRDVITLVVVVGVILIGAALVLKQPLTEAAKRYDYR